VNEPTYKVAVSGRVAEQIEDALLRAEREGLYRDTLKALRWAKEEM
jgi:hypothetical protein